eukprot:m.181823 g.181823  ORF g.181823 m.181823 type:complete len:381 (+) comp32081_c1_seq3:65-1207(+)
MASFVKFVLFTVVAYASSSSVPTPPSYNVVGSIEVDTNENTLFKYNGNMFVLENIPCYYSQHFGFWNASFANASYARIRSFETGEILVNISETIGFGFVTAFVDLPVVNSETTPSSSTPTFWLFGSACNRCSSKGQQGCISPRTVQSWWSPDMLTWKTAIAEGTKETYNVQVSRVNPSSSSSFTSSSSLPPHRYVMMMEPFTFAISNGTGGDLSKGWQIINSTSPKAASGGPSIRWNPMDGMYYVLTGGHTVLLVRTRDFHTWDYSLHQPFIHPTAADANVAPFAGFPGVEEQREFPPMHDDYTRWDWNSNDADLCCFTENVENVSYVIWGAGTQGARPHPPLTKANHCTNVVGVANISLGQLLMNHFVTTDVNEITPTE